MNSTNLLRGEKNSWFWNWNWFSIKTKKEKRFKRFFCSNLHWMMRKIEKFWEVFLPGWEIFSLILESMYFVLKIKQTKNDPYFFEPIDRSFEKSIFIKNFFSDSEWNISRPKNKDREFDPEKMIIFFLKKAKFVNLFRIHTPKRRIRQEFPSIVKTLE